MAIKKSRTVVRIEPDPFLSEGFAASNIKTTSREISDSGEYIKYNERLSLDFSSTSVKNALAFSKQYGAAAPPGNTVMSLYTILPTADNDDLVNNSDFKSLDYSMSSSYNYYSRQYESQIADLEERQIINIYNCTKNGTNDGSPSTRHFSNEPISKKSFLNMRQRGISYLPVTTTAMRSLTVFPIDYDFSQISSDKLKYPFAISIKAGVEIIKSASFSVVLVFTIDL